MAHPDPLLPQARAQQVKCYYGHVQVEDANSSRHPLCIFFFHIKKEKKNADQIKTKAEQITNINCDKTCTLTIIYESRSELEKCI